jgi:hypothetical protein
MQRHIQEETQLSSATPTQKYQDWQAVKIRKYPKM